MIFVVCTLRSLAIDINNVLTLAYFSLWKFLP